MLLTCLASILTYTPNIRGSKKVCLDDAKTVKTANDVVGFDSGCRHEGVEEAQGIRAADGFWASTIAVGDCAHVSIGVSTT